MNKNVLTNAERYRLTDWLKRNDEWFKTKTLQQVADLATGTLGFLVTLYNVAYVARSSGIVINEVAQINSRKGKETLRKNNELKALAAKVVATACPTLSSTPAVTPAATVVAPALPPPTIASRIPSAPTSIPAPQQGVPNHPADAISQFMYATNKRLDLLAKAGAMQASAIDGLEDRIACLDELVDKINKAFQAVRKVMLCLDTEAADKIAECIPSNS